MLAVVTTYYNPCRYKTRKVNFDAFRQHMIDSGVKLLTVECVFEGETPELPIEEDVIHLSADSLLWQKERLLNLAVQYLPKEYTGIAWIDCDVIFDNENWVKDTLDALDVDPIVQMFESCIRLDRHGQVGSQPDVAESFASVMRRFPESMDFQRYDLHGHTGYAWAMRRVIFDEVGLYEHAISGSSDHFMAHAIYDNYNFCIQTALKSDPKQINHLKAWGALFYPYVQGRLGLVRGTIRHLWHGDLKHRNYYQRMHQITDLGYDPTTDVDVIPGRPLAWSAAGLAKTGLVDYFKTFFHSRLEDGDEKAAVLTTQEPRDTQKCSCHPAYKKENFNNRLNSI